MCTLLVVKTLRTGMHNFITYSTTSKDINEIINILPNDAISFAIVSYDGITICYNSDEYVIGKKYSIDKAQKLFPNDISLKNISKHYIKQNINFTEIILWELYDDTGFYHSLWIPLTNEKKVIERKTSI